MDEALKKALNQPEIDDTLLSAVEHADLSGLFGRDRQMDKLLYRE
jgi:hypothetical protein